MKLNDDNLDIGELKIVPNTLSSFKSKVDKLDIGKLETTPVGLKNLSDVVKITLLKRLNMMNWLKSY